MKDFIASAWWRICVVFVSVGILTCSMSTAIEHNEARNADKACREVLKCIDLGVEREHCDELYPACTERGAP